jgi:hypothetical protein
LRGRNVPADSLSNGQVQKFMAEMALLLGPELTFIQLDVSLEEASLSALVDWKRSISQLHEHHSTSLEIMNGNCTLR